MLKIKTFKRIVLVFFLLTIPFCIISYNHIGEDCFITFRYAENFASGKGLVYNAGEWIEGYSNFLWVIILSFFSFLGYNTIDVAKILSALFYALILFPASYFFIHTGQKKVHSSRVLVPVLLLFNPMLHYHVDRCLETPLYTFLLLLAFYLIKYRKYFLSSLIFLTVALTRPEGFIYFCAGAILPLWDGFKFFLRVRKHISMIKTRPISEFFIPFIVGFLAYIFWRHHAYGYFLPNTVYLKVSKWNFIQNPSVDDLWNFTVSWSFLPLLAIISFIFLLKVRKGSREKKGVFILGVASLLIIAYNTYIGKVLAEPFRHLVPLIPFLIIIIGEGFRQVAEKLKNLFLIWTIAIIIGLMNFYTVNNYDAPASRLHIRTIQFLTKWDLIERIRWFFGPPLWLNGEAGEAIRKIIPKDSLGAVDQMGQFGYYSKLRLIDLGGLIDTHIAHQGFSKEYLFSRNPDYCIIYASNGIPHIYHLKLLIEEPEFKQKYFPIYVLKWKIDTNEFIVYIRQELAKERADQPSRIMYVGPEKDEWNKKWRIFPIK